MERGSDLPGLVRGDGLGVGNPLCGRPRASEGSFPSAFSPCHLSCLSPTPTPSAAAPAAGKSGPDRISSADLRLLEAPLPPLRTPRGHELHVRWPRRPRQPSASLATLLPAPLVLSSRPLPPLPFPARVPAERCFTPPRVPEKPSHAGARRPGARTPQLGRGGAWWGGSAGEVFKLEPEPPPRGSGSRGAVEQPWASAGRDPGIWRGVGPWRGGRFAQNVPGLRGRGAAAALSQVGAAPRARLPAPRGTRGPAPLARAGCGEPVRTPPARPLVSSPAAAHFARGARLDSPSAPGLPSQLIFPAKGEPGVPI